jgi:ABC-type bacteriocin/lantibiotic exporter with double-glycine peptidase domain
MDEQTHLMVYQLIAKMGCTVLAIIHRLNGLEEYDWVIGKHFEENYSGNNH